MLRTPAAELPLLPLLPWQSGGNSGSPVVSRGTPGIASCLAVQMNVFAPLAGTSVGRHPDAPLSSKWGRGALVLFLGDVCFEWSHCGLTASFVPEHLSRPPVAAVRAGGFHCVAFIQAVGGSRWLVSYTRSLGRGKHKESPGISAPRSRLPAPAAAAACVGWKVLTGMIRSKP